VRIIRSIWIWTAGGLLIVGWTLLVALVRLVDRDPLRLRTARIFRRLGPLIARVNPWRIHIKGLEHLDRKRVYVIVSNHQSLADIPLIAHLRFDAKWLAKAELFRVPFVGWMMSMSDDVPVARGDRRKAAHALLQCARYLRQRCSVMFFPEGTRSRDGQVLPFNDGPFQLAIREQVAVLPLVVDGSRDALPRNSWLFGNALDIHLRVLEPVPVEGATVKDAPALREQVRQRIIDELDRIRRPDACHVGS
jgi:1-acyl-sn-glycerol-3-phosphate acyltransferase